MTKQVTPEQLEIWLQDPVTQAYLDCMQYCLDNARKHLADGKCFVPSNADLTLYNTAFTSGYRDALSEALSPQGFLGRYERAEVANA